MTRIYTDQIFTRFCSNNLINFCHEVSHKENELFEMFVILAFAFEIAKQLNSAASLQFAVMRSASLPRIV